eukprot:GDKI01030850.1.p1 GENE.GDKI01030850.1~~GDKI01030850.1.p1  ORF type:complete len:117 (-),score=45.64 GDKI01030850.1:165-515(-)
MSSAGVSTADTHTSGVCEMGGFSPSDSARHTHPNTQMPNTYAHNAGGCQWPVGANTHTNSQQFSAFLLPQNVSLGAVGGNGAPMVVLLVPQVTHTHTNTLVNPYASAQGIQVVGGY